jgi:uncharacterized membrane protein YeaQ/YmgE (transglycosylase-associated protein family)
MGLIISLLVGGIVGWIASLVLRTSAQQGTLLNVIIGILGSLLGAFFLGSRFGGGNLLDAVIDPRTLVVSLIGSIFLLGIVHLVRRRRRG